MKRYILAVSLIIPGLLFSQRLGLGVIAGSPTGLSFKYLLSQRSAFSAHAGWSFIGDKGVHITGDYQYLFPMVIKTAERTSISDLTPYIAAGGRFRVKETDEDDSGKWEAVNSVSPSQIQNQENPDPSMGTQFFPKKPGNKQEEAEASNDEAGHISAVIEKEPGLLIKA